MREVRIGQYILGRPRDAQGLQISLDCSGFEMISSTTPSCNHSELKMGEKIREIKVLQGKILEKKLQCHLPSMAVSKWGTLGGH